ncbi:MAG: hypothetical protein E7138_05710 [Rikenellaceae bacterium]|nr:hypothetical protein [Rikenellaceae bacterium]
MTAQQFFKLVTEMREAQKEYFRFKNNKALVDSKRLEKAVDAEIERVKKILYEKQNPKLDLLRR